MVCRAVREHIKVVELGIIKNASHACNGTFNADFVAFLRHMESGFDRLPGGSPKIELEQKKSIPILFIP